MKGCNTNMAKKKKKSISLLEEVDKNLNGTYDDLLQEIQDMQIRLNLADQKARKLIKKKKYKNNFVDYKSCQKEIRKEVLSEMQSNNMLDRIQQVLNDVAPIVVIIARLVASLILSILSIDSVKVHIKPELLSKMNSIYNTAMSIS